MQEEILGPVLPILGVDDVDEAELVNSRDKPLALYVYSGDESVAKRHRPYLRRRVLHQRQRRAPLQHQPAVRRRRPPGTGAYHGKASFDVFTHSRWSCQGTWLDIKGTPYDEDGLVV